MRPKSRRRVVTAEDLRREIAELEKRPEAEVFESRAWHALELARTALRLATEKDNLTNTSEEKP